MKTGFPIVAMDAVGAGRLEQRLLHTILPAKDALCHHHGMGSNSICCGSYTTNTSICLSPLDKNKIEENTYPVVVDSLKSNRKKTSFKLKNIG